ncbi:hypothetical protein [Cellulosimicrobium protaetiae]|uniref:Uncharacterized protein n=1 Tax=Cellulosimicrobium protaetiae TaxID=2587808 RepID=A0A6M5UDT3_9MICO|nr:hypothetical protein [Cellulosimicrobium protaetiae]QJW36747.1 hypothetical protein FIC82_011665 [Cellulosimicrobium protaetiae]
MGEQRPGGTLEQFSDFLGPERSSRPDVASGTYDGRYTIFPAPDRDPGANGSADARVQTDVYEYHWSHLMQGNRLDDLWPTVRRVLFPVSGTWWRALALLLLAAVAGAVVWQEYPVGGPEPRWVGYAALGAALVLLLAVLWRWVPPNLRGLWVLLWGVIVGGAWLVAWLVVDRADELGAGLETGGALAAVVAVVGGGAAVTFIVAFVVTRVLPSWLTASFVDVVRYVDTSPRSYAVRTEIRKGMVDLLERLHTETSGDEPRYHRIVVLGHSLGSFIAYDGIRALWVLRRAHLTVPVAHQDVLARVTHAARRLDDGGEDAAEFRSGQRDLWEVLDSRWRITDFVSFGSPLTFAHMLVTRDERTFERWCRDRVLVTSPPVPDDATPGVPFRLTRKQRDTSTVGVLHESAPFAVVRWTNLYYRARMSFFGDWFGGPLARRFGRGVLDLDVPGDGWRAWMPAWAHALYLTSRARARTATKPTFRDLVLQHVDLDLLGRTTIPGASARHPQSVPGMAVPHMPASNAPVPSR